MREIEVNSDKGTVLGVLFVLALVLFSFLSGLYSFLRHYSGAQKGINWTSFLPAVFNSYAAVVLGRDTRIRKAYPYGLAGLCLMAVSALTLLALHWADEMVALRYFMLGLINLVAAGLVLFEGVRWFRGIVKVAEKRTE